MEKGGHDPLWPTPSSARDNETNDLSTFRVRKRTKTSNVTQRNARSRNGTNHDACAHQTTYAATEGTNDRGRRARRSIDVVMHPGQA